MLFRSDMCSASQRAHNVVKTVARLHGTDGAGRVADGLHYEGYCATHGVRVGDCQGDAFAVVVVDDNDEVARASRRGYQGSFDYELHDIGREMLFF